MILKRLLNTIILNTNLGPQKRADYLRSIFGMVGQNVDFMPRLIPLYPELIKLHNNIVVASGVGFITHDAIHVMINRIPERQGEKRLHESIGCIEVMDNVFIGAKSQILYGVKIGTNVIIGANSLVNKDLEPNSVYAGIPARRICSFEDFVAKRSSENRPFVKINQRITSEEINDAWSFFEKSHKN